MMPDSELNALRADMLELQPSTVVIERKTHGTAESYGYGGSASYSAIGTVTARVDPLSRSSLREMVGARESESDFRQLTIPFGADIAAGDRVVFDGRRYEIRTLDDDHSLRAVRRAVMVVTV